MVVYYLCMQEFQSAYRCGRPSSARDHLDAARAADDGAFGQVQEQAGFDDADDASYAGVQRGRVVYATGERAVKDKVAIVGDEGLASALAQLHPGPQLFQAAAYRCGREWHGFAGQRSDAAQLRYQLGRVADHKKAARGGGHDFFAQQRAAAALDEEEPRVDLVCAIDGEIESRVGIQAGEWDAQAGGKLH